MEINVQYLNEFDKFGDARTKQFVHANRFGKPITHTNGNHTHTHTLFVCTNRLNRKTTYHLQFVDKIHDV